MRLCSVPPQVKQYFVASVSGSGSVTSAWAAPRAVSASEVVIVKWVWPRDASSHLSKWPRDVAQSMPRDRETRVWREMTPRRPKHQTETEGPKQANRRTGRPADARDAGASALRENLTKRCVDCRSVAGVGATPLWPLSLIQSAEALRHGRTSLPI